jgi:hypothetical protein
VIVHEFRKISKRERYECRNERQQELRRRRRLEGECMMATKKDPLEERFYHLLETLFRELDQDSIRAEVDALREQKPDHSREKLARELITRTSRKTALVGATAGIPGGAFGLLAAAPDIFNLVRSQSRLVLSIAFLYDQKPGLEERFREVLAVLALSTGASATRQGVRYLIQKGLTGKTARDVVRKIAGRYMARRLPVIAPVVGSVVGAGFNWMAVQATGKFAIEYYASLAPAEKPSAPKGSASKAPAKSTGTKSSAARKSPTRKPKANAGATTTTSSKKEAGSKKPAAKRASKTPASKKAPSKKPASQRGEKPAGSGTDSPAPAEEPKES